MACTLAALLSACVSAPPDAQDTAAAHTATPPADPAQWVGDWHGTGPTLLRIMPDSAGHYHITLRSRHGSQTDYQAQATGGHLLFQRGDKAVMIQPQPQDQTDPGTACLVITPGHQAYCRDAASAAGLPLARGAYVAVKHKCSAARRNDTLYFNGKALARPGQHACHAHITHQQGIIFHIHDGCAPGASATGKGPNETLTVPDRHHLALRPAGHQPKLYRYCTPGLLPPNLQRHGL